MVTTRITFPAVSRQVPSVRPIGASGDAGCLHWLRDVISSAAAEVSATMMNGNLAHYDEANAKFDIVAYRLSRTMADADISSDGTQKCSPGQARSQAGIAIAKAQLRWNLCSPFQPVSHVVTHEAERSGAERQ